MAWPFETNSVNDENPSDERITRLTRLFLKENRDFDFAPEEPSLCTDQIRYFDEIAIFKPLLMHGGQVVNLAMGVSECRNFLSGHEPENILLDRPDLFYMSQPSPTPFAVHYMSFSISGPVSFLWSLQLNLMRVTSHVGQPLYAPQFLRIFLSNSPRLSSGYIYSTAFFTVSNTADDQCFSLPLTAPYSSYVHVVFCGLRQRNPLDNQYYLAIQQIRLMGVTLSGFAREVVESLERSRISVRVSKTSGIYMRQAMRRHIIHSCNNAANVIDTLPDAENKQERTKFLNDLIFSNQMTFVSACTARYSGCYLKLIQSALRSISLEASQFLRRRGQWLPVMSKKSMFTAPNVKASMAFMNKWGADE